LKDEKKCYEEDEYNGEIEFETWSSSKIEFYPPEEIPANGVVTLHRAIKVEKCFGSAGCIESTEEEDIELGTYMAEPFIKTVIDLNKTAKAEIFRKGGRYEIQGTYFGERGDIFLVTPYSARKVEKDDIDEWSSNTIVVTLNKSDVGDALEGIRINNTALGSETWEISGQKSQATKSSSSQQSSEATTTNVSVFTDISASHNYYPAISWAKNSSVLQGYPDGTFKPDRKVNRAEFLKIVLEAKGVSVATSSTSSGFSDVDENAWYAPYVRYAKEQGIVQGYPNGMFKPEQAVNFAEALKMAYNALGITTNEIGSDWYERFLQHAKLNSVLFTSDARVSEDMNRKDVVWIVWKLMTHDGDWQQPSKVTNTTPPPTNTSAVQFKDGTFVVGKDIQAGTYRTRKAASGCYYSRLNGFSGELEDINSNELTNAPSIVTIDASDKGFKSSGCGTWTQDLSAITTSRTSFGDGMFIVGTDIDAGTYKNSGGSSCYYSRLSGFSGELDDIVSNELTSASAIVTISDSDKGFKSAGCGTWTKM